MSIAVIHVSDGLSRPCTRKYVIRGEVWLQEGREFILIKDYEGTWTSKRRLARVNQYPTPLLGIMGGSSWKFQWMMLNAANSAPESWWFWKMCIHHDIWLLFVTMYFVSSFNQMLIINICIKHNLQWTSYEYTIPYLPTAIL